MRKMFTKLFGLTLLMYLVSSFTVVKAQCNLTIAEEDVVLLTDITTKCDSDLIQYAVTGFPDSTYFNFNSIAGDPTPAGFTLDSTIWVTEGTGFTVQVRYNDTCYTTVLTYPGEDLIQPVYIDTLLVTQPLCADDKGELTVVVGGTESFLVNFVDSATWYAGGKESGTYTWYNGSQFQANPGTEYFVRVKSANNCTSLGWDSISVADAPAALEIADVNTDTDTVACIGDSATVTVVGIAGGTAPYYVTLGGQTDTLLTPGDAYFDVPAGTYYATVVDTFGCELTSDSMAVIVNPAIVTFDISIDDVSCADSTTGTIYVHTLAGGSGTGYQASIGDGDWVSAINPTLDTIALTGLGAGYYSVYVRDDNGCDSVGYVNPNNTQNTVSVQSPGGIEYDVVIDTATCYGDSSVISVTNVSGGSEDYVYTLNGTESATGSWTVAGGSYDLVVSDAVDATCEIPYSTILLVDPQAVVINSVDTVAPTCPGGNDGVINITATHPDGGELEYSIDSISWYPNNIFAVAADTFTVYVRDANCPTNTDSEANVIVRKLEENVIVIDSTTLVDSILCYGDDNGYVDINVSTWARQADETRIVSIYMTTDAANLYVSGDSTTTGVYDDLAPGTYYFWAEDNLGCQSKNTITVTVTEAEELTISGSVTSDATCYGAYDGVMTITAGTGVPTYYAHANTLQAAMATTAFTAWPSGADEVEIQVGKATYYVVAKDACGDKAYAGPFTVGGLEEVTITDTAMSVTNIVCYGDSTGVIEVFPAEGGNEDFTYTLQVQTGPSTWVNVQPYVDVTETVFEQLPAATYKVVVTDAGGCDGTETGSITVEGPGSPVYRYDWFERDISCYGASDGAIGIWIEGGTPPYQFKIGTAGWRDFPNSGWEGNPTQEIVVTEPGTYTVWVRDSLGCMSVDGPYTYTIEEPKPILLDVAVTNVTDACDANNGQLAITASGAHLAGFDIYVNNVQIATVADSVTVTTPDTLHAGTYVVTVVENSYEACEATETVIITAPDTVTATAEVTADVSCNGGDNGEITVSNMSGGTVFASGIYNVTISPDLGVKDTVDGMIVFSELPADTFDITVTDSLNCSYTIYSIPVVEPTALTLNATHIADITCAEDGSFSVQATGGVGDYKYFAALSVLPQHVLVPEPTSPAWQDSSIFTVSAPGTYIVWAMDANGCVIGGEENDLGNPVNAWRVKILEPEVVVTVEASAYFDEVACNGDVNDTITLDAVTIVEDGVTLVDPEYTVTINDIATDTLTGVGAGTYVVVVTHESGCSGRDTVVVTEPEALTVELNVADGEFSCPDVTEGYIEASAMGGTPWSGGMPVVAELKSAGSTKGYSNYEFQLWRDGVLKTDYIDIDAFLVQVGHTYQVVVRDANGCTDTSNVITIDPVAPVVIESIVDVTCSSDTLGSVLITVSGEAGREFTVYYDQIESDSPEDSGSATVSADGTVKLDQVLMFDNENIDDIHYAIWVEDEMGCVSGIDTITIDQIITSPLELVVTEGSMEACQQEITVSASGGVAPYVFTVNGEEIATTTVLLSAGANLVEATDVHGCVVSQEVVVDYAATLDTTITIYEGDTANFVYETIDTMLVGGSYTFYYDIDTVCVGEVNVEVVEMPKVAPVLVDWTPTDTIETTHPIFVLTFNTGVSLGDGGQLTVTPLNGTTPALVLDLTEAMFTDSTITVDYDGAVSGYLDLNTTYFVQVDSAAVMGQGIVWEGISNNSWQFTTGDSIQTPVIDIEAVDFNVYPNPFNNYIKIDNYDKLSRVIISNIAGQRVLDIESPTSEIRTGNLVTGVYVVTLIKDNAIVKSERIIKR